MTYPSDPEQLMLLVHALKARLSEAQATIERLQRSIRNAHYN